MDDTDGATLSELDIYVADVLSPPTADPAAPGRELCVCVCVRMHTRNCGDICFCFENA